MKRFFTLLFVSACLLFGLNSFYMSRIEKPSYSVEKTLKDRVEIRVYDAMIVAKTSLPGASFDDYGSQGFKIGRAHV